MLLYVWRPDESKIPPPANHLRRPGEKTRRSMIAGIEALHLGKNTATHMGEKSLDNSNEGT